MTPPYGGTDGNAATSSYGGTRLLLAMLITWLMGGSASQFMIPLFLNVARGLPPFTYNQLPLASGGESKGGGLCAAAHPLAPRPPRYHPDSPTLTPCALRAPRRPGDPERVYPGLGQDGRTAKCPPVFQKNARRNAEVYHLTNPKGLQLRRRSVSAEICQLALRSSPALWQPPRRSACSSCCARSAVYSTTYTGAGDGAVPMP